MDTGNSGINGDLAKMTHLISNIQSQKNLDDQAKICWIQDRGSSRNP
jgi:hypothetical protein